MRDMEPASPRPLTTARRSFSTSSFQAQADTDVFRPSCGPSRDWVNHGLGKPPPLRRRSSCTNGPVSPSPPSILNQLGTKLRVLLPAAVPPAAAAASPVSALQVVCPAADEESTYGEFGGAPRSPAYVPNRRSPVSTGPRPPPPSPVAVFTSLSQMTDTLLSSGVWDVLDASYEEANPSPRAPPSCAKRGPSFDLALALAGTGPPSPRHERRDLTMSEDSYQEQFGEPSDDDVSGAQVLSLHYSSSRGYDIDSPPSPRGKSAHLPSPLPCPPQSVTSARRSLLSPRQGGSGDVYIQPAVPRSCSSASAAISSASGSSPISRSFEVMGNWMSRWKGAALAGKAAPPVACAAAPSLPAPPRMHRCASAPSVNHSLAPAHAAVCRSIDFDS